MPPPPHKNNKFNTTIIIIILLLKLIHPTYESSMVAVGDSVGALTGEVMERSSPLFSPIESNPAPPDGDKPPPIV